MPTTVTNLNDMQINVRLLTSKGLEYAYVAPKSRITLDDAHQVDPNWLAQQVKVKVDTTPAVPVTPVTPTVTTTTP